MLDNVLRLREPAAWIVIAVTAANIVLALVRFGLALGVAGAPLAGAAQDVALGAMNLSLVIVVVALVWVCVFHAPTPGAARVTTAAAVVVTVGTLVTITGALMGLAASAGVLGVVLEFLGGLLDIILKAIATITLWLIHRGLRGGRIHAVPVAEASPSLEPAPPVPSGPAPSWRPEAASGSVWTSASDAAEGAPARGHGVPGPGAGWRPVARDEPAAAELPPGSAGRPAEPGDRAPAPGE